MKDRQCLFAFDICQYNIRILPRLETCNIGYDNNVEVSASNQTASRSEASDEVKREIRRSIADITVQRRGSTERVQPHEERKYRKAALKAHARVERLYLLIV